MRNKSALILLVSLMIISCSPRYMIDHSKPTRPLDLPKDNRAHYDAQMECWYYTVHLMAGNGTKYGFEVTFFNALPYHQAWR